MSHLLSRMSRCIVVSVARRWIVLGSARSIREFIAGNLASCLELLELILGASISLHLLLGDLLLFHSELLGHGLLGHVESLSLPLHALVGLLRLSLELLLIGLDPLAKVV